MSANRELIYKLRKHMPDNQLLHNLLASKKLRDFKKQLIPRKDRDEGEHDPAAVPAIVRKYEKKRSRQCAALTELFDDYLRMSGVAFEGEEYEAQRTKMLFNCLAYGFAPDEYVYYRLEEKTQKEKLGYVTDLDRKMMQYIMSDFKDLQYVFDKAATYEKFGKYFKREEISIASKDDFDKFREFAGRHNELIVKQVAASCGRGITVIQVDPDRLQEQFDQILALGKCSVEERIRQSDAVSVFNDSSVNTLRVITFNTKHGVQIGPCFYRTGRAGSFVDNAGSGGVFCAVDRTTGILDTDGWDEYLHRYEKHPDSGVTMKGFQLPDWDSCIALVREMCALVPKIGYIGWDLAYTDRGWILVEANGGSQFMTQICYEKGCKKEVRKYIRDRNIYR